MVKERKIRKEKKGGKGREKRRDKGEGQRVRGTKGGRERGRQGGMLMIELCLKKTGD